MGERLGRQALDTNLMAKPYNQAPRQEIRIDGSLQKDPSRPVSHGPS